MRLSRLYEALSRLYEALSLVSTRLSLFSTRLSLSSLRGSLSRLPRRHRQAASAVRPQHGLGHTLSLSRLSLSLSLSRGSLALSKALPQHGWGLLLPYPTIGGGGSCSPVGTRGARDIGHGMAGLPCPGTGESAPGHAMPYISEPGGVPSPAMPCTARPPRRNPVVRPRHAPGPGPRRRNTASTGRQACGRGYFNPMRVNPN